MSNSNAKFLTGAPMRHVAVMSATASIGLMAMFVVDFVDMIFISMLGNAALAAAIGYAGSILFFTTSFGIGIAIAAGALVARALGSGDEVLARSKASHALFYGVVLGAIFAAAVWFNVLNLVTLVGASGETAELAASYLRIIIPSLPILVASIVASAVLRSHGAASSSMYVTILGGVVNAILDPIFIFALDMNLAGAAWASVAARIASASLSFYFLFKNHGGLEAPDRVGLLRDFNPVMVIAIPAILTQLATPVGAAFAALAMAEFGEAAVAGMAVIGRLVPLAFGVVFALSGAVGPIIGQNYGAGQMDRVKRTFYDALMFTGAIVVVIALALFYYVTRLRRCSPWNRDRRLHCFMHFAGRLRSCFILTVPFLCQMPRSIIWGIPIIPHGLTRDVTPSAPFHSYTWAGCGLAQSVFWRGPMWAVSSLVCLD